MNELEWFLFDLLSGGIGLKTAAHLRGLGFWTNRSWMSPNQADSIFFWSWLCVLVVQASFKQRPLQEGRMGMMGYTYLHIQPWVLRMLAGSGWKSTLEGGRDVPTSPKRTGTLELFTRSISWSVQLCASTLFWMHSQRVFLFLARQATTGEPGVCRYYVGMKMRSDIDRIKSVWIVLFIVFLLDGS